MEFLKQIAEQAEQIEQTRLYEGVEQELNETFDTLVCFVLESEGSEDKELAEAACTCMMKDKKDEVEQEEEEVESEEEVKVKKVKKNTLKEAFDEELRAELELLESLKEITVTGLYSLLSEDFDKCVDRILKSDRKLRMTSKDGKTKYKSRRRAAEAACAASMAAVFSKRGVSAKAIKGKRGGK